MIRQTLKVDTHDDHPLTWRKALDVAHQVVSFEALVPSIEDTPDTMNWSLSHIHPKNPRRSYTWFWAM